MCDLECGVADSSWRPSFLFEPELALNTERRKCLLGNMTNQGMGKAEKLIDLFPFCLSFLQLPSSGISPNWLLNGITVPLFQKWEKEKDLEMCSDDACRVALLM